ncbi:uroporphyrinogen-III synthase [Azospirillum sp. SYSU D00513]|uniref:uroporphyrinogen-III synthase n=1 Tax=Azospirillum sp. SYSU D00513 TaxID=2812561 RepID=UPI001A96828F|nr:uroporphyrinogen-III synthase [Azospirillum sp. SYSU D00513]
MESERRPRILVTRPAEDAAPLAEKLRSRGYEVALEPMLEMVWLDGPEPDLTGVQALLFTSANGVRAYAKRTDRRDRPAYAVGDSTAAAARAIGFERVESASGDVYALADLVRRRCAPAAGGLLHVAGSKVAGDLAGLLGQAGFSVRRETLYEAVAATRLSALTSEVLRTGSVEAALFFSPRTARSFVTLLGEAELAGCCRTVDALCLSPAVADAARAYGALGVVPWRSVRAASRPDQDGLLDLLAAP